MTCDLMTFFSTVRTMGRLYAMEARLCLKSFSPQAVIELRTAKSESQRLTYVYTELPGFPVLPVYFARLACLFLCPATKSGGVLCYTLRTFERLSVCPSVHPSAVYHSCPLHNFDTIRDNFTKLGTNIKHDQTTCRY